ncbi:signal peptidase I [Litorimonas sp. RW-G-Af-16]|uniref:signal peptidase I n=1 Tax=Litorimonas sp. RW-G-Af-16 TaxID=3241168 RepID=UPI00390C9EF0
MPSLMFKRAKSIPKAEVEPKSLKGRIVEELTFFSGLAVVLLSMMTFVWGHFKIPSESMLPTLEVGDHIYVSKFAYGFSRHSLPFGLHAIPGLPDGKFMDSLPTRGDVAVFRNPKSGMIMIKRIVGLPGDKIQINRGRLTLNGKEIARAPVDNYLYREHKGRKVGVDVYTEQLPGQKDVHYIYEQTDQGPLDNTGVFTVPAGAVFFMGDNRDNSTDSRDPNGPGFVPLDHLMGRADLMMFSFKQCDKEEGLRCPPKRFMQKL